MSPAPVPLPSQPDPQQAGPVGVGDSVQALIGNAGLLAKIEIDRAKMKIRNTLIMAAAGFVTLCGLGVLATASAILVLYGMAGGLSELLGGRYWLGCLLAGLFFLIVIATAISVISHYFRRHTLQNLGAKYKETIRTEIKNERDFLNEQSALAKGAFSKQFGDLGESVRGSSVMTWAKAHPVLSCAIAASVSYAVGSVIFSRQSAPTVAAKSGENGGEEQSSALQWIQYAIQVLQALKQ